MMNAKRPFLRKGDGLSFPDEARESGKQGFDKDESL